MSIPKNITKEHLLAAISKIEKEGIPKDADSQYYDVIYDGKRYPPKLIVSFANLFANGEILDRNSFNGGLGTECFNLLEQNDFIIEAKLTDNNMTYFEEIRKFLTQAKTSDLKTAHYTKTYLGLKVRVSFGQANPAEIPWIAFLSDGQTVQNGIYPVYLFFKEKNILILAYGLSETTPPSESWNISNATEISNYFSKNSLGRPKHYGNSLVYKVYNTTQPLNEKEIIDDLNNIIHIYKQTLSTKPAKNFSPMEKGKFEQDLFFVAARESGLSISSTICLRFIASLLTKPFLILTGLSGSGKTKLAQAFVTWICESENQYCIVPVGADWTNREPLLGFPNALKSNEFVKPDNKVIDLIIAANEHADKPYFLILDEMNLSHVERYFADFLSVMESKGKISLHGGSESWSNVPSEISIPENLFIIGTVNIDETTYMFSPKVLDRANVIEFRVTANEMKSYLESGTTLDLESLKSKGSNMADKFVEIASDKSLQASNTADLQTSLMLFFSELKKTGAEFGYRSASEIFRFAAVINTIDSEWTMTEIIDAAIIQKLLPKVHGSRRKLEPILKTLGKLCLHDGQNIEEFISAETDINFTDNIKIKYPLSLEKILRMYHGLIYNGFTSYAEA